MAASNENMHGEPTDASSPAEPDGVETSVETSVGAESPRRPIADIGTPAYDGVDVYSGDDAFEAPHPYDGASTYEAAPALGVADAYEGPTGVDAIGAYEPEGAYTPAVTPVAAEAIVPDGVTAPTDGSASARVDPIGVYVPEDVPAAALPHDEIAESESATADVSVDSAAPLPGVAIERETGETLTPREADGGPSAVRFDD
ncbi:hypothetical protein ELQ92_00760 [Labedella populi]|uniref:Uncharacterized protein n=1 Tax=Labedella populi TaxID=2498850 RepID=A0A3S3ZW02_9MICO|nr:hypothetical protein [Labedella populi]RWZ67836.1 hypothetical protein ELQ92_00760 [Labedella populi]